MEIKTKQSFNNLLESLVEELLDEEELDEFNTTGSVGGAYMTPFAFDPEGEARKKKYKKPNTTERKGLVTSRVGQGYYRQQVINKWEGKCPLTDIDILSILISSHIVPWSESNDEERLDVDNGILLSPMIDSLFDRHLISFDDDGTLLISSKLSSKNIKKLNLLECPSISLNEGMLKYIKRHRKRFRDLENDKSNNV